MTMDNPLITRPALAELPPSNNNTPHQKTSSKSPLKTAHAPTQIRPSSSRIPFRPRTRVVLNQASSSSSSHQESEGSIRLEVQSRSQSDKRQPQMTLRSAPLSDSEATTRPGSSSSSLPPCSSPVSSKSSICTNLSDLETDDERHASDSEDATVHPIYFGTPSRDEQDSRRTLSRNVKAARRLVRRDSLDQSDRRRRRSSLAALKSMVQQQRVDDDDSEPEERQLLQVGSEELEVGHGEERLDTTHLDGAADMYASANDHADDVGVDETTDSGDIDKEDVLTTTRFTINASLGRQCDHSSHSVPEPDDETLALDVVEKNAEQDDEGDLSNETVALDMAEKNVQHNIEQHRPTALDMDETVHFEHLEWRQGQGMVTPQCDIGHNEEAEITPSYQELTLTSTDQLSRFDEAALTHQEGLTSPQMQFDETLESSQGDSEAEVLENTIAHHTREDSQSASEIQAVDDSSQSSTQTEICHHVAADVDDILEPTSSQDMSTPVGHFDETLALDAVEKRDQRAADAMTPFDETINMDAVEKRYQRAFPTDAVFDETFALDDMEKRNATTSPGSASFDETVALDALEKRDQRDVAPVSASWDGTFALDAMEKRDQRGISAASIPFDETLALEGFEKRDQRGVPTASFDETLTFHHLETSRPNDEQEEEEDMTVALEGIEMRLSNSSEVQSGLPQSVSMDDRLFNVAQEMPQSVSMDDQLSGILQGPVAAVQEPVADARDEEIDSVSCEKMQEMTQQPQSQSIDLSFGSPEVARGLPTSMYPVDENSFQGRTISSPIVYKPTPPMHLLGTFSPLMERSPNVRPFHSGRPTTPDKHTGESPHMIRLREARDANLLRSPSRSPQKMSPAKKPPQRIFVASPTKSVASPTKAKVIPPVNTSPVKTEQSRPLPAAAKVVSRLPKPAASTLMSSRLVRPTPVTSNGKSSSSASSSSSSGPSSTGSKIVAPRPRTAVTNAVKKSEMVKKSELPRRPTQSASLHRPSSSTSSTSSSNSIGGNGVQQRKIPTLPRATASANVPLKKRQPPPTSTTSVQSSPPKPVFSRPLSGNTRTIQQQEPPTPSVFAVDSSPHKPKVNLSPIKVSRSRLLPGGMSNGPRARRVAAGSREANFTEPATVTVKPASTATAATSSEGENTKPKVVETPPTRPVIFPLLPNQSRKGRRSVATPAAPAVPEVGSEPDVFSDDVPTSVAVQAERGGGEGQAVRGRIRSTADKREDELGEGETPALDGSSDVDVVAPRRTSRRIIPRSSCVGDLHSQSTSSTTNRRSRSATTEVPSVPISSAALASLTTRNSRKNEAFYAQLDVHVLRINAPRPPSPTSKIRRTNCRSQRAKKRNGDLESDNEEEDMLLSESSPRQHTKGAGENEIYTSPITQSRKNKNKQQQTKGVHWRKRLFTGPTQATVDSDDRPSKSTLVKKSYGLDRHGNIRRAAEAPPSPSWRKVKVSVSKIIYNDDDDDDESEDEIE
ncbi:unnamed protein product [Sympodiomycopsis kandeliae]